MIHHEARLLYPTGHVTLKAWRRSISPEVLSRELSSLASQIFQGWRWGADGEAGLAIEPTGAGDSLLLLIDNPCNPDSVGF